MSLLKAILWYMTHDQHADQPGWRTIRDKHREYKV